MGTFDLTKYKCNGKSVFDEAEPLRYGSNAMSNYATDTTVGEFQNASQFPFNSALSTNATEKFKLGQLEIPLVKKGGAPGLNHEIVTKWDAGEYIIYRSYNALYIAKVIGENSNYIFGTATKIEPLWRTAMGYTNDKCLHSISLLLVAGGGSGGGWAYYDVKKNAKSGDNRIIPGTGGGGGGFGVCFLNLDILDNVSKSGSKITGNKFRIHVGGGGKTVANKNYFYSHDKFKSGYNGLPGGDSWVIYETVVDGKLVQHKACRATGGGGGVGAKNGVNTDATFRDDPWELKAGSNYGYGGIWRREETGKDDTEGFTSDDKAIYFVPGKFSGGRGSDAGIVEKSSSEVTQSQSNEHFIYLPGYDSNSENCPMCARLKTGYPAFASCVPDKQKYDEHLVVNGGNSFGYGDHYEKTKDSETGLYKVPANIGGGGSCSGYGFEKDVAGKASSWIAWKTIGIGLFIGTPVALFAAGVAGGYMIARATLPAAKHENVRYKIGDETPGAGSPAAGGFMLLY